MNKKILLLSIFTTILSAETFINPLPSSVKSTDNGGVKQAIDAYKDGIGAELMDKPGVATDNSGINTLVFKYGDAAKISGKTIANEVLTNPLSPQVDIQLANKIIDTTPISTGVFTLTEATLNSGINLTQNKGNISFVSLSNNAYGYINFAGLFDNTRVNEWNTARISYWYPSTVSELKVNVTDTIRLWRSGTASWTYHNCKFGIKKKDLSGNFIEATTELSLQTTGITHTQWELFTNELTPGEYIFYTNSTNCSAGRIDSEWFAEKKI